MSPYHRGCGRSSEQAGMSWRGVGGDERRFVHVGSSSEEDSSGGCFLHRSGVRWLPAPSRLRCHGDGSLDSAAWLRPGVRREDRGLHEGGGHSLPEQHGAIGAAATPQRSNPGEVPGKRLRELRRARRGGVRHRGELHRPVRRHGEAGSGQPGREDAQRQDPVCERADERSECVRNRRCPLRQAGTDSCGHPGRKAAGSSSLREERRADELRECADDRVHSAGVRKLRADGGGGDRAIRRRQRGGVRQPVHSARMADFAPSPEGGVLRQAGDEAGRWIDPRIPHPVSERRRNHSGIWSGVPDPRNVPESDGSGRHSPHDRRGVHDTECDEAVRSFSKEGRMLRLSLRLASVCLQTKAA